MRLKTEEKKIALLKATLSLINDNGFHDAPMGKIAKLANVSPATIYLYFENKQDLTNQLYLSLKEDFGKSAFEGYSESMGVYEGFKLIWHNIAQYKLNQVAESVFLAQCDSTPIVTKCVRMAGLIHLQPLLTLWEKGRKNNTIKPISDYLLYAYSIYPLSFLMNMKQENQTEICNETLTKAWQTSWDAIKQ
ncbi:MAG: TetR/AcrR family transcriptional regulator [Sphingobacteriaceae bacterium]|nr:TetR/AcrR family transcriptional regulator [Sphingobacteriaceae bacterium]